MEDSQYLTILVPILGMIVISFSGYVIVYYRNKWTKPKKPRIKRLLNKLFEELDI